MGDRGTVAFAYDADSRDDALVYTHHQGSDLPHLLDMFFTEELSKIGPGWPNRFDDPEYLAARFVAFLFNAGVGGVGVGNPALSYDGPRYRVLCDQRDQNPPRVVQADN